LKNGKEKAAPKLQIYHLKIQVLSVFEEINTLALTSGNRDPGFSTSAAISVAIFFM
jgi:hypothetical protein